MEKMGGFRKRPPGTCIQRAHRPESENTLIYLIQHESREKADKNWQSFSQDPDWKKVARNSQRQGKLLKGKPERLYLKPLDFSPAK